MKIKTAIPALIVALSLLFTGCAKQEHKAGAFLARDQKHYDSLGIGRDPSPKEDGLRTSGQEKTYEWWYFDSEFKDGTKVVAVFYTKHKFDVKGPAHPTVVLDISLPDGRKISKEASDERGKLIRASRDKCDVQVKDSFMRYKENGNYEVHVAIDDITFDCLMKPKAPMWRPGTGFAYYGDAMDKYLAWFVAVPAADLTAKLAMGSQVKDLEGSGYHDHNWGNEEMQNLINHWYWARVVFDNYTMIASDEATTKKYGYTRLDAFMLAKDGKIIDDNEKTVKIIRSGTIQHPVTKKFMDNNLTWIQKTSDGTTYKIDLIRKADLINIDLLQMSGLSNFMIRVARLMGENPTYIRLTGDAILTITDKDNKEQKIKTTAIWEQMHFGKNKEAIINDYR